MLCPRFERMIGSRVCTDWHQYSSTLPPATTPEPVYRLLSHAPPQMGGALLLPGKEGVGALTVCGFRVYYPLLDGVSNVPEKALEDRPDLQSPDGLLLHSRNNMRSRMSKAKESQPSGCAKRKEQFEWQRKN